MVITKLGLEGQEGATTQRGELERHPRQRGNHMERPRAKKEPGFSRALQEGKESLGGREVVAREERESLEHVVSRSPGG